MVHDEGSNVCGDEGCHLIRSQEHLKHCCCVVLCHAVLLAGGLLGLMNIVSKFLGGAASDKAASSRGMRGRMWVMFILLLLQGVMCLLVGISHDSLAATVRPGSWTSPNTAVSYTSCFCIMWVLGDSKRMHSSWEGYRQQRCRQARVVRL